MDSRIGIGAGHGVGERARQVAVDGVQHLGAVQSDPSDPPVAFIEDCRRHRGSPRYCPARKPSRSLNFWILPEPVIGNASTGHQTVGVFWGERLAR